MKNTKWIWRVLAVLVGLVVLTGVGFAGYRVGLVQGADLTAEELSTLFAHKRGFDGDMTQGENGARGYDGRMNKGSFHPGERGSFSLLSPVFGLFRLAILGGLVWLGYTLFKRSGWRLVNVHATQTVTPTTPTAETPSAQGDEKKDEA